VCDRGTAAGNQYLLSHATNDVPLMPETDIGRASHFNRQISDLHITRPGELAYGRVDTAKALLRTIDTLNGFRRVQT
jgi:hypothetical protein